MFCCIVPTHLRPELLENALRSIREQDDFDRLVGRVNVVMDVDDDETRAVVSEFSALDPRFVLLESVSDRPTASVSRNVGARGSKEPFLAFLDDDDEWAPAYLRTVAGRLADGSVDAVFTSATRIDHRGATAPMPPLEARSVSRRYAFARGSVVTGSNIVLRRELFEELGGYDESLAALNDTDLLVRLLALQPSFAINADPLVLIRSHPNGQLTNASSRRADQMRAFLAKHRTQMSVGERAAFRYRMQGTRRVAARSVPEKVVHLALQLVNAPLGLAARRA